MLGVTHCAVIIGPLALAHVVPVRYGLPGPVRKGPDGDAGAPHKGLGANGVLDALDHIDVHQLLHQHASQVKPLQVAQCSTQVVQGCHWASWAAHRGLRCTRACPMQLLALKVSLGLDDINVHQLLRLSLHEQAC